MLKGRYLLLLLLMPVIPAMTYSAETSPDQSDYYEKERLDMVERQIIARGVKDPRVLEAMKKVPRHLFVPKLSRDLAYRDYPLSIDEGQTISQPYIVAFMTEALELSPGDRVMEVGTGSGYQAAILAEIGAEVYTIELLETLADRARDCLATLSYENIHVKTGDGYLGWPEKAPFDAVIVTCAPENIPKVLVEQLKDDGKMIIPVGKQGDVQELIIGRKVNGILQTRNILSVRFVPMVKSDK